MKIQEENVRRIIGIGSMARKLGVSRSHIWKVANGQRSSDRISIALRKAGISIIAITKEQK